MKDTKSSILLSFVGRQDPFARPKSPEDLVTEGSLVSLFKFLKVDKERDILQVILLCSDDTRSGAEDCKEWIHSEYQFPLEKIEIRLVSQKLSDDPIDLELAVVEARSALERSLELGGRNASCWIDFNASSGTPTMKQAWGILQASGYANHSTVWQVRDPKFIKQGQQRVFASDLSRLKAELDLKVLRQQVDRYDYAGALGYLPLTQFDGDRTLYSLLEYGRTRLALDASSAYRKSVTLSKVLDKSSKHSIEGLKDEKPVYILQELYWQMQIARKNQNYSSALGSVIK